VNKRDDYDMMAGCQAETMLAAYNYISLIVNTIQRKERENRYRYRGH